MKIKATKKQATEITLTLNTEEAQAIVDSLEEYDPNNSTLTSRQSEISREVATTMERMITDA